RQAEALIEARHHDRGGTLVEELEGRLIDRAKDAGVSRIAELLGKRPVSLLARDDQRDPIEALDRGQRRGLVLSRLDTTDLEDERPVETELGQPRRRRGRSGRPADSQRHYADAVRRHPVELDQVLLRRL